VTHPPFKRAFFFILENRIKTPNRHLNPLQAPQQDASGTWQEIKHNTNIYVNGLPDDVTVEEVGGDPPPRFVTARCMGLCMGLCMGGWLAAGWVVDAPVL
jgi:hypothetical protein